MIKLGDIARDKVTGFQGMVVARIEYLNGCVRLGIQPTTLDKDGKMAESMFIDDTQCEKVDKEKPDIKGKSGKTGGPGILPKSRDPKI